MYDHGKTKNEGIFFYLLFLTGFFLLLEIGFFIQSTQLRFDDFNFVSSQLHIPVTVWPSVIFFITVQLILHFLYCLLAWCAAIAVIRTFNVPVKRQLEWGIGVWLLGVTTILVANQYWFPNSKFAELVGAILFNAVLVQVALGVLLILATIVLAITVKDLWLKTSRMTRVGMAALFAISVAIYLLPYNDRQMGSNAATKDRPNIIIVGIDSLRPDFLSFFGHDHTHTPFIDKLLSQSTVFGEAVTPLARTFPSWVSILTGSYPREVNVRSNLADQTKAILHQSLPALLQQQGYQTIYATDETRFSNITKAFGFDQIISPPVGLNDFLIGTFNDFPLSNLLVNTRLGQWLFPYSYGNRPVHFTYHPDSFLNLMQPALEAHYQQPVFLAVHFCLPHAPYAWASLEGAKLSVLERYERSINRVDQQVQDLFALLKQNHFLDHAILVLLSDHGEALELDGDRITEKNLYIGAKLPKFYPPSLDEEDWNQSAGHGTDVLGLTQYHSLLAFRLYGADTQAAGVIPGVVSLTEIKPTILQLLGLKKEEDPRRPLASIIRGQRTRSIQPSHIFLESDYSPESIRTVYPETRKVVLEGVHLFQIDPTTTRLTVKPAMEQMIIQSKQYADIYGKWMLALYPQDKLTQMPILINLETGEWTNELTSPFARRAPLLKMQTALKQFYGDEVKL